MNRKMYKEGIEKIGKHFSSLGHVGLRFVADFEEVEDEEERARIMRDAYETVQSLLDRLAK